MNKINLQNKAKAEKGTAKMCWFADETTGLERTLFHKISIPLTPFNSGLEKDSQPVKTKIALEWLALNLPEPSNLEDFTVANEEHEKLKATIYIGGRHNLCEVNKLTIRKQKENMYSIEGELLIDFEDEGVAENEHFTFKTTIELKNTI